MNKYSIIFDNFINSQRSDQHRPNSFFFKTTTEKKKKKTHHFTKKYPNNILTLASPAVSFLDDDLSTKYFFL